MFHWKIKLSPADYEWGAKRIIKHLVHGVIRIQKIKKDGGRSAANEFQASRESNKERGGHEQVVRVRGGPFRLDFTLFESSRTGLHQLRRLD